MSRRTTSRAIADDSAYPIRIKFKTPPRGFGNRLTELHQWLARECGSGLYAVHPAPTTGGDAIGVYVRSVEVLPRLLAAFPDLESANAVKSL